MNLQKILNIGIGAISIVGFVFWVMIVSQEDNKALIGGMIWFTKILFGLSTLITIAFSVKHLIANPKKLKMALTVLAALIVIVGVSYAMSTGVEVKNNTEKVLATAGASKWVGAGLRVFYIMCVICLGAIAFGGVKKVLNK